MLLKEFNGISYGKTLKIELIYEHRVIDVSVADWILLYTLTSARSYLDIGASSVLERSRATIDVRTTNIKTYGKLKERLENLFKGQKFIFKKEGTPTDISSLITDLTNKSAYADILTVTDASTLSENEYVTYTFEGEDYEGWVFWINDKKVYIYKSEGDYIYMIPSMITDLSNRLKGLYRFTFDVGAWGIEPL